MPSPTDDLCLRPARDLAAAIAGGAVSAEEVMRAHLDRIEALNPRLRAMASRIPDGAALAAARAADRAVASGAPLGPLHGLPVAVMDVVDVEGLPTGHGSPAHAGDGPATHDGVLPRKLRDAGAIIVGKTTTSEHGIGALTSNEIDGTAANPWDPTRHAGGSAGGSAAAVATGMVALADGFDSAGNVRFSAAMCGVVGLRPTPGTVPSARPGNAWNPLGVLGPLARTVADTGLALSGTTGLDDRWPLSWVTDPSEFGALVAPRAPELTIAWSDDCGGVPVDPELRSVHAATRKALEAAGVRIVDAEPDFTGADDAWETIEMFEAFSTGRHDAAVHGTNFGPHFLANNAHGAAITPARLADAHDRRTVLFRDTARLLTEVDVLVAPATPIPPPVTSVGVVQEVDGHRYDTYYGWQALATRLSLTAHPVLVLPCGRTAAGLPVAVQVVGRYRGDRRLLEVGAALEAVLPAVGTPG